MDEFDDEDYAKQKELEDSNDKLSNTQPKLNLPKVVLYSFFGAFTVFQATILFSLIPTLRGKGAPFLPTKKKIVEKIFEELKTEFHGSFRGKHFADLGSGDGRLVIAATMKGFESSFGVEINPMLVAFSWIRFFFFGGGMKWNNLKRTTFSVRDLWKIDLSKMDVVVIYGVNPIMQKIGQKLKSEMKPGSIVVSNVFQIPNLNPYKQFSTPVSLYFYKI